MPDLPPASSDFHDGGPFALAGGLRYYVPYLSVDVGEVSVNGSVTVDGNGSAGVITVRVAD